MTAITAIGIANPEYKQYQKDTAEFIAKILNLKSEEKKLLKSIYRATGIETRHSVLNDYCKLPGAFDFFPNKVDEPFPSTATRMKIYKDHALNLALSSIRNCFSTLKNFDLNTITHLITVSCTGMYAPGIDIEIVHALHLHSSTQRISINFMGCYGAFNAIKVADAICKADTNTVVLIVCVELCSIHIQKSLILDDIISNSIFADGAAAIIVQSSPRQNTYLSLEKFHSDILENSKKDMTWHIGNNGFDIKLSTYVSDLIQSGIADFTNNLLRQYAIKVEDIDYFAIHPGGMKILQACEQALNINKAHNKYSYQVLRDYGNMSSATVLFVLKSIWDDISSEDHDKNIFSCAFGPGLTLESMLLKVIYDN